MHDVCHLKFIVPLSYSGSHSCWGFGAGDHSTLQARSYRTMLSGLTSTNSKVRAIEYKTLFTVYLKPSSCSAQLRQAGREKRVSKRRRLFCWTL